MPAECFAAMLQGVQGAVRLLVEHLAGRDSGPGRPPRWVQKQSAIGLVAIRRGSVVAELALTRSDVQHELFDYGSQALDTLLNWSHDHDENTHIPGQVKERIAAMSSAFPEDMTLFLGTPEDPRRVEMHRRETTTAINPESERPSCGDG